MTFYAKPTNRPLALEGWFEKPKNRLFGHVRVKSVYGIEQLVNGLSYASDVLGILLNVNRWVKKMKY